MMSMPKAHVPGEQLHQSLGDRFILWATWTRWYHCRGKMRRHLRVAGVDIRVVDVTLEHALLQTVRHRHRRHPTVVLVHPPVTGEPVRALHVRCCPGKGELTEAQPRDKHPGRMDLTGFDINPLDRVSRPVNFHPFSRGEIPRRHTRLTVLRELAVELLPEVRVGRQRLGLLLPDQLHRVSHPEVLDHLRPLQLQHPRRVGPLGQVRRRALEPIADLPHGGTRAAQCPGNLPDPSALSQTSLDLFVSSHGQSPVLHPPEPPSCRKRQGYGGQCGRLVLPRTAARELPGRPSVPDRRAHGHSRRRRFITA